MSGPMNFVYPVQGDTTDVWGTALNTLLGLAENHTHEPGKGVQVPTAGLALDADLTFASFAALALKAVAFTEQAPAAVTSYSDALFVSSADHNLYFRNQSGVNVQVTAGNTLNISLVGGIGGDYAAVNALLSYDDATHRYLFQQEGSPRPWAGAAVGNVDIYEQAASIANRVRLQSPSGLAASYAVTWPTALPAAGSIVQVDAAGQMTATNTLANNQNLKLQGTGYLQRGNSTRLHPFTPVAAWQVATGSPPAWKGAGTGPQVNIPASTTVYYPLEIGTDKDRVISVTVYGRAFVGAATLSLYLSSGMNSGTEAYGALNLTGAVTTLSVPADGLYNPRVLTLQTPTLPTAGEMMFLRVDVGAGNNMDVLTYGVTTDVP